MQLTRLSVNWRRLLYQVANAKWKYDANGFGRNTTLTSSLQLLFATGGSQNISTVYGKAKAGLTNIGANSTKLALCVDDFQIADLTTLGMETNVSGVADVSYTLVVFRVRLVECLHTEFLLSMQLLLSISLPIHLTVTG